MPDLATARRIVRLAEPVAARPGDRFVLRRGRGRRRSAASSWTSRPPRGLVAPPADARAGRRRSSPSTTPARHDRRGSISTARSSRRRQPRLAADVVVAAADAALAAVGDGASARRGPGGRRRGAPAPVTLTVATRRRSAAAGVVDELVADGRLVRDGDALRPPGRRGRRPGPGCSRPRWTGSRPRWPSPAPPSLAEAARAAGCPPDGVRALERAARIVVLEPDLAYAMTDVPRPRGPGPALAAREPLTPAAFRDATGTSRKYVMAILEDLDRRAILRRTPAGHVPGPKAPAAADRDG